MRHISTVLDDVLAAMKDGTLINPECVCTCGRPKGKQFPLCNYCSTALAHDEAIQEAFDGPA